MDDVDALCSRLEDHVFTLSRRLPKLMSGRLGSLRSACTPMALDALQLEAILIRNGCRVELSDLPKLSQPARRHSVEFFQHIGVCRSLLAHVEECEHCRSLRGPLRDAA